MSENASHEPACDAVLRVGVFTWRCVSSAPHELHVGHDGHGRWREWGPNGYRETSAPFKVGSIRADSITVATLPDDALIGIVVIDGDWPAPPPPTAKR